MSDISINPPRRVRVWLYLTATFAVPTVAYLSSTGKIGDALTVMLGSYIAIVLGLATANTLTPTVPADQVVTRVNDKGAVVAGEAATVATGEVVPIVPDPNNPDHLVPLAAVQSKKLAG